MLNIEIDGKQVEVQDGSTIMDAAVQAGIRIPHFCYHKKLSIAANCRMCLVQVEKAPKPLPACATPVTDGMKVMTHSDAAVRAQKGVMEFLLINHPLDCPICDQGGECQLQDMAVGYGASASRYQEEKRVVLNKNLGPLISTDMTRCIHCSRCVRFGQEIAGIMELGMAHRGEHTEVMPFMQRTVDSELSGNVIDLCPVGALTNKPFRYSARTWEMGRRKSVSPHDGLGTNMQLHVKNNKVMRAVPAESEEINECWLADRDRFSYEGLYSEDRLTRPMIRRDGAWRECEWQEALEYAAAGLRHAQADHGAASIAALASPHQTVEELYLLQKLLRGLGSDNLDYRLRQTDFSADGAMQGAPWLGTSVASLQEMGRVLLVGSTLRKDHPLLAHRLREAVKRWGQLNLVNPVDDDLYTSVSNKAIVAPRAMVNQLAQILRALAEAKGVAVPTAVAGVSVSDVARKIADSLAGGERKAVLLGNLAQHHPQAAQLHQLAQEIAALSGASFGFLGEAANSVGAHLAGMLPGSNGLNAKTMLTTPRKAYVLMGVEPELDCYDPAQAMHALHAAEFVVAMTGYKNKALDYAHVLLPIAGFAETSGTYVSTEGRVQSFNGAVKPVGEARPAWKVLRVLGNLLELDGFTYDSSEQVRSAALDHVSLPAALNNQLKAGVVNVDTAVAQDGLQRIGEVPIYQLDTVVRRAFSLQQTHDAAAPVAWMSGVLMDKLGVKERDMVNLRQNGSAAALPAARDDRLPADCVRVAAAHVMTAGLGGMLDSIIVERVN